MELTKKYIYEQVASQNLPHDKAKLLLKELQAGENKEHEDIAIIGMACKFPGADSIDKYWDNLKSGVISIGDFPEERKDDVEYVLKDDTYMQALFGVNAPEEKYWNDLFAKSGALKEIDKFDAAFFGIPPREAKFMEPVHRVFLETAWEAIENGGYGADNIYGTRTGVFVGRDNTPIRLYSFISEPDPMHLTGQWAGILASRLSYIYNLNGPAMVIDTACASGLVSVHTACQSLRNKECDMAIAAGVQISIGATDKVKDSMSLSMVESTDGTVRTFDKNATGTIWGEGVGVVLLKPLKKALEDGDNIHAIIKGSAINNDGASNGITAPNAAAQEDVILRAWKNANINPESINYIEGHGTGTVLGDPIEIKGITNAFKKVTDKKQFCGLGSVKPSLGHLVGASGLASLIKVVLSLKNKAIPASLNFDEPNPYINFTESPVFINDTHRVWERGSEPRRAGVSSFGFSGTNCHVVLEEFEQTESRPAEADGPYCLALSAKNDNILHEIVSRFKEMLDKGETASVADICYTWNTGRGHFTNRLALVVMDYDDLKEKMNAIHNVDFNEIFETGVYYGEHKVVPDNKKVREKGEYLASDKRQMTKTAEGKVQELLGDSRNKLKVLDALCRLYANGADIDWQALYKDQKRKRVSVPVYPLERIRVWAGKKFFDTPKAAKKGEFIHTLLDNCIVDSLTQRIYTSEFRVETHWILNEHIIMDNNIVVGTALLEMVVVAGREYFNKQPVEVKDMIFLTPIILKEDEMREVHTIVNKKEEGYVEIVIASKLVSEEMEDEVTWIKHAEGKVYLSDNRNAAEVDKEEVFRLCDKPQKLEYFIGEDSVFKFGPRWYNINAVRFGDNKVFLEIELPENLKGDMKLNYVLHPAMMDHAVNVIIQKTGIEGIFLPFTYKSIKVYMPMPERFYSYLIRKENLSGSKETVAFDVVLFDESGKVIAEVKDYIIKKVQQGGAKIKELAGEINVFYEKGWRPCDLDNQNKNVNVKGSVLLFKDEKNLSDKIAASLRSHGRDVIEVKIGSSFNKENDNLYIIGSNEGDYLKLISEIKDREFTQIIHLASITSKSEFSDIKELKESQKKGTYGAFYLIRSLLQQKVRGNIDIAVISEYINDVTGDERINPHNAALAGIGKVVEEEYGHLKFRCIDIDDETSIETIMEEIMASAETYQVAYRNNKRYVAELRRIQKSTIGLHKMKIKEQGVYIITGGTGGLGLEIGKYLASKNNVKLALINRSQFLAREEWDSILNAGTDKNMIKKIKSIQEIEQSGSEVLLCKADIADYDSTKNLIDRLRKDFGAINGIVHSAGSAGDGFIINKDEKVFTNVLSPKVYGTWILDKLTRNDNLDFFVMFSSITSLMAGAGQGDYTAANSYLDSYAAYRNRLGRRTVTVNWPAWKETGMAVDYQATDDVVMFKSVSTSKAIGAFEEILNSRISNVFPGELNYPVLSKMEIGKLFNVSPQIRSVIDKQLKKMSGDGQGSSDQANVEIVIKGKSGEEYTPNETKLAVIWAKVLGISEIDIYMSFDSMGGDSILASQLAKEIGKEYPGVVDITDIFSYPSVIELSEYIDNRTGVSTKKDEAESEGVSDDKLKNLLDGLESDGMSIDDALEALGKD